MIKDRAHRRPYRAIAITIADHDTKVSLSSRSLLGADNEMLPVSTCIMNRIQLEVAIIWHESHACISWIGNALSFIGQNYGLLPAYINVTQHNTGLKWRRRCVVSVKNHYTILCEGTWTSFTTFSLSLRSPNTTCDPCHINLVYLQSMSSPR